MTYWQGVLSRLNVPGVVLMVIGAVACYAAPTLSRWLFREKGGKAVAPMKGVGLALAILGALILMDFIPNL